MTYEEYTSLCDVLTRWAEEYAAGTPSVPDSTYDAKYLELKQFEAEHPSFILDNSPTKRVIDGATGFKKVRHDIPMISISNSNGIEEATEWADSMLTGKGVGMLELEHKIDGLGLALIYSEGQLIDAVTRGTDNVGDSVWTNALMVQGIPHNIPGFNGEVRGEVVWKFQDFDEFNDRMTEAGKKTVSNPRNGATGTLKLHDPKEVGERKLSFIGYLVVKGGHDTQHEDIEWLESVGFEVPEHHTVSCVGEFQSVAEDMRERRFTLDYPIDGVVIKVDDKSKHDDLGYTAKSPNFYRAYKFPPEEKETVLLDVERSGGVSGAITPVAIMEPVHLAMTTVSRCSLPNWDLVEYLGLTKGCKVVIRKAGEIIPEIVKCIDTGRTKDDYKVLIAQGKEPPSWWEGSDIPQKAFITPRLCPFCHEILVRPENADGSAATEVRCPNASCKSQVVGRMSRFVSRECMNIMGIGPNLVELLHTVGKLNDITDFYKLDAKSLTGYGNIREKSAEKIIRAIDKSRGNFLHQLVEGFSVEGVGHQASPVIAKVLDKIGGLGGLLSGSVDDKFIDFCLANGVGQAATFEFLEFVRKNSDTVRYFVDNGISQTVKDYTPSSAKLAGRVCIMTGVFDKLEREKFKELVVANGGTICSSITKKCNLVLMGDGAGPKKVAAIDTLRKSGQQIDVYTPETLDKFLELVK